MNKKLKQILEAGLENLQVVLDFDRTITGPKSTGESAPPMIAFLRNSDMLGEKYREAAQTNFEYYRPLELSGELSHEEKTRHMHKWWAKHLQQLVDFGLTRDKIAQIANSPDLICRNGVVDFMKFCHANNIPVIIFSAGILGSESMKLFLERYGAFSTNVKIITNELVFNEDGKVTSFREPIIHSENKSEEVFGVEGIVQRKNTILAGDGVGDAKMVLDKPGSLVYRYATLDNVTEEIRDKYLSGFDEVVSDFSAILSQLERGNEESVEVGRLK